MLTSVINPKVLVLLSEMINMVPPGQSHYSRVMLPYCDEVCQESRVCKEPGIICDKPQFEEWQFEEMKKNLGKYYSPDMDPVLKEQSYSRAETYEEGLVRYLTIAQAAYEVSIEKTMTSEERKIYYTECGKWNKSEQCSNLRSEKPWKWGGDELAFGLITIANHESSFRRDVHSGNGELAMGDCIYVKNGQRTHKNDPGAKRVCRSACLNQIKFQFNENIGELTSRHGVKQENLIGLDLSSTKECFSVSADLFAKQRGWCELSISGDHNLDWVTQIFSAYGTGSSCAAYEKTETNNQNVGNDMVLLTNKPNRAIAGWVKVRSHTFWNAFNHRRKLKNKHLDALNNIIDNYTIFDVPRWLELKISGT